jgi:hypothetical protein
MLVVSISASSLSLSLSLPARLCLWASVSVSVSASFCASVSQAVSVSVLSLHPLNWSWPFPDSECVSVSLPVCVSVFQVVFDFVSLILFESLCALRLEVITVIVDCEARFCIFDCVWSVCVWSVIFVGKELLFIRVTKRVDALFWKIFDNRGEELEEK